MTTTVVTFGPDQRPEPGAFAMIDGCTEEQARGIAFALFGPEFCTTYAGEAAERIIIDQRRTLVTRVTVAERPSAIDLLDAPTPITDRLTSGEPFILDEAVTK